MLDKLRELAVPDEDVRLCEQAADEQAAELDRLEEPAADYRAVDLRSRGISEAQARDLRARLKTFAEDWDRLESPNYEGHSLSMLRRVARVLNAHVRVIFESNKKVSANRVAEQPSRYRTKRRSKKSV